MTQSTGAWIHSSQALQGAPKCRGINLSPNHHAGTRPRRPGTTKKIKSRKKGTFKEQTKKRTDKRFKGREARGRKHLVFLSHKTKGFVGVAGKRGVLTAREYRGSREKRAKVDTWIIYLACS